MRLLGIILVLSLTACAPLPIAGDGVQTKMITINRLPEVSSVCNDILFGKDMYLSKYYYGCATWTDKSCTIYAHPDEGNWVLGHELRHCFEGAYHK